jgi:hypothetical protein
LNVSKYFDNEDLNNCIIVAKEVLGNRKRELSEIIVDTYMIAIKVNVNMYIIEWDFLNKELMIADDSLIFQSRQLNFEA